jgi:hypothetical protein
MDFHGCFHGKTLNPKSIHLTENDFALDCKPSSAFLSPQGPEIHEVKAFPSTSENGNPVAATGLTAAHLKRRILRSIPRIRSESTLLRPLALLERNVMRAASFQRA